MNHCKIQLEIQRKKKEKKVTFAPKNVTTTITLPLDFYEDKIYIPYIINKLNHNLKIKDKYIEKQILAQAYFNMENGREFVKPKDRYSYYRIKRFLGFNKKK
jgi:hypothetical protein